MTQYLKLLLPLLPLPLFNAAAAAGTAAVDSNLTPGDRVQSLKTSVLRPPGRNLVGDQAEAEQNLEAGAKLGNRTVATSNAALIQSKHACPLQAKQGYAWVTSACATCKGQEGVQC